jgi:hypothetical protein
MRPNLSAFVKSKLSRDALDITTFLASEWLPDSAADLDTRLGF